MVGMTDSPPNDWLPISNADLRNWGPWIYHGMKKKRPAHVRVSLGLDGESDVAIYVTEGGSGWGRNHSPTWEEITWYRLRCEHPYYHAARADLSDAMTARIAELEALNAELVEALELVTSKVNSVDDSGYGGWVDLDGAEVEQLFVTLAKAKATQ